MTSASTAGTRNDTPPHACHARPSTTGTAIHVANCGEPTLLTVMSAMTRASESTGSSSTSSTPRRAATMPRETTASTASASSGVMRSAASCEPSPTTCQVKIPWS